MEALHAAPAVLVIAVLTVPLAGVLVALWAQARQHLVVMQPLRLGAMVVQPARVAVVAPTEALLLVGAAPAGCLVLAVVTLGYLQHGVLGTTALLVQPQEVVAAVNVATVLTRHLSNLLALAADDAVLRVRVGDDNDAPNIGAPQQRRLVPARRPCARVVVEEGACLGVLALLNVLVQPVHQRHARLEAPPQRLHEQRRVAHFHLLHQRRPARQELPPRLSLLLVAEGTLYLERIVGHVVQPHVLGSLHNAAFAAAWAPLGLQNVLPHELEEGRNGHPLHALEHLHFGELGDSNLGQRLAPLLVAQVPCSLGLELGKNEVSLGGRHAALVEEAGALTKHLGELYIV